jgi:hypothetical protein
MSSDHTHRDSSSSWTREAWLRDFALLLRVRGADGARIGDVLAEVEAHCADSGQTPREAFGEPADYAASLHLPTTKPTNWTTTVILPVLGLVIGINLTLGAVLHWSSGVAITVGDVASMVVFIGFLALLIGFFGKVVMSPGALIAWFASGFVLMVALPLVLPQTLATVHPVVALSLGLLFVALGVLAVRRIPADPIVDPRKA